MKPEEPRCISFDEWVEEFNPVNPEHPYEDHEELCTHKPKFSHVWTLIENDNETLTIASGFHVVNWIGFYLTEKSHDYEHIDVQDNC